VVSWIIKHWKFKGYDNTYSSKNSLFCTSWRDLVSRTLTLKFFCFVLVNKQHVQISGDQHPTSNEGVYLYGGKYWPLTTNICPISWTLIEICCMQLEEIPSKNTTSIQEGLTRSIQSQFKAYVSRKQQMVWIRIKEQSHCLLQVSMRETILKLAKMKLRSQMKKPRSPTGLLLMSKRTFVQYALKVSYSFQPNKYMHYQWLNLPPVFDIVLILKMQTPPRVQETWLELNETRRKGWWLKQYCTVKNSPNYYSYSSKDYVTRYRVAYSKFHSNHTPCFFLITSSLQ